ncbi:hypothetical protein COCNU_02G000980 [Cocos nucifera]|uniref:Uncharacterized protein n=1 Tax=Cocos nucifera TaxID=13894 RepID=A0A8K0HXV4_COCNU|nr:hypothetical protein COCNU_02G000980 [Cocos nucifera]
MLSPASSSIACARHHTLTSSGKRGGAQSERSKKERKEGPEEDHHHQPRQEEEDKDRELGEDKKIKEQGKKNKLKAITVSAARLPKMPGPLRRDVQETNPRRRDEDMAYVVGVVMVALIFYMLNCLMLRLCLITELPILTIGFPYAVLAMALCIRAASRTGTIGDSENGGTAEVAEASHDRALVGSDGAGEHVIVRPPVVTIPSSSSSSWSGSGVVTGADVELGGASHHRRGERRGGADMSGEAIRDGKGKNA